MKTRLWAFISCFVLAMPVASQTITNGSFEVGAATGPSAFPYWTASGTPLNPGNFTRPGRHQSSVTTWDPVDGQWFAVLRTAGLGTPSTSLSQALDLTAGDQLSGWAGFHSQLDFVTWPSSPGRYEARVSLTDSLGDVSILWQAGNPTGSNLEVAWEQWNWVVPSSGEYSLQLTVRTITPSTGSTDAVYGLFDAVSVIPIPEPGTVALLLTALGVGAFRRLHRPRPA
jgi:hypothetical protein